MKRFDSSIHSRSTIQQHRHHKGANSNDEEEDTGETWLLNTLLVDGEEQEFTF